MLIRTMAAMLACAAAVAGCHSNAGPTADIAKITDLKSSFGKQFAVTEVPPTGIDPKFLTGQRLPDGLKFEPPECAQFAAGQLVPTGTEGNMAAVSAEGEGNRFIVIAVETNEPVPVTEPGEDCSKVTFDGGMVRGTVESVEVPKIDGDDHHRRAPRGADDDQRQAAHRRGLQLLRALRRLSGDRLRESACAAGQADGSGQHPTGP